MNETPNKRSNQPNNNPNTKLMVLTALLTAMTTLATLFFRFPIGNGYIHLGDSIILLAAILLPCSYALFAGAVGACLADIISGYAVWAPWSFFIKLVMVLIMQAALHFADHTTEDSLHILKVPAAEFIGFLLAGIETVAGYYVAEGIIYGNWITPAVGAPFNFLQVLVGAVLAVLISQAMYRAASSFPFRYRRK